MLANGTLLGYKLHGSEGSYTDLEDLKTVPDMGGEPELVENTPLKAATKRYEIGIGDPGSMEYTFTYDNNRQGGTYRTMREFAANRTKIDLQETWPDGTKFRYTAVPSVSFTRGGINGVIDLKVKMAVCSDIEVIDPEETQTGT